MLLDGAVWHTSRRSIEVYEQLNIPVLIAGPYAYDGCPIELFFSGLKRGNLNPEFVPLSKSKYIFFISNSRRIFVKCSEDGSRSNCINEKITYSNVFPSCNFRTISISRQ